MKQLHLAVTQMLQLLCFYKQKVVVFGEAKSALLSSVNRKNLKVFLLRKTLLQYFISKLLFITQI